MLTQLGDTKRWLALGLMTVLFVPSTRADEKEENPILAFVKKRVKDADKPFTLIVGVKVKEGKGEKFEAAFAKALIATRKEKGCLTYDLNRDSEDAGRYQVYERWKSVADLEAHLNSAHIKALREVLPEVIAGDPELRVLVPASE